MRSLAPFRRLCGRRRCVVVAAAGLLVATLADGHASATPEAARPVDASAAPAEAPKVTGVQMVIGTTVTDFAPVKTATAICPEGKQVVGGGTWPWGDQTMTLTGLEPFRSVVTGRYGYQVTAAELPPGPTHEWRLDAFAFCANPIPGYQIVPKRSGPTDGDVLTADPVCPNGRKVLGSGALVHLPEGPQQGIGLQVARADAAGGMVRTQARRTLIGSTPPEWALTGYAICADEPYGYVVATDRSDDEDSQDTKSADVDCPPMTVPGEIYKKPRRLLSIGGAVSNIVPGNFTLSHLTPHWGTHGLTDDSAWAGAHQTSPPSADWDYIVVRVICVPR